MGIGVYNLTQVLYGNTVAELYIDFPVRSRIGIESPLLLVHWPV